MSNEKGQSLMELIVVITVIVFVVGALTFATIASLRNAVFAQNQAQATKLAQEGIERVRTDRDRKAAITGFQLGSPPADVNSWDDDDLWSNQISSNCIPNCYFNISTSGVLQYIGAGATVPLYAEPIAPGFKRVVVLSDEAGSGFYRNEKKVTVVVIWTDFSGPHESKLTTILRKL
ncbi:prepilin-type N-terminal cleavage/methylation domain-containing protein [Candidatus Daviesbacteria bacterium]|nr:prepilin-type N-terminal cleavage/methylation domain-containing protein [Candidatus Daviesbacteria bacterium]